MSYTRLPESSSKQPGWLQSYDQNVRTNRLWRHSFGRISCLARIPIYTIAAGLQTAKTLSKTAVSPITYLGVGVAWLFNLNAKPLKSWRFEAIAKDALMDIKLLDKIGNSAMGVIFAPQQNYITFRKAFKGSIIKTVILGKVHGKNKSGNEYNLEDVKKVTFVARSDYLKLIFDENLKYPTS